MGPAFLIWSPAWRFSGSAVTPGVTVIERRVMMIWWALENVVERGWKNHGVILGLSMFIFWGLYSFTTHWLEICQDLQYTWGICLIFNSLEKGKSEYIYIYSMDLHYSPERITILKGIRSLHSYSYCWWLKSCTTWDVWNPKNNGINYLPQLVNAGFQPSTVGNHEPPALRKGFDSIQTTFSILTSWIYLHVCLERYHLPRDPITWPEDEQGVYNQLLSKVFRFHDHSQKLIGSLGSHIIFQIELWILMCYCWWKECCTTWDGAKTL